MRLCTGGLHCVTRGKVRVVVHGLTVAKSRKEIRVVGGEVRKLGIEMSLWQLFVDKHNGFDGDYKPYDCASESLPSLVFAGQQQAGARAVGLYDDPDTRAIRKSVGR